MTRAVSIHVGQVIRSNDIGINRRRLDRPKMRYVIGASRVSRERIRDPVTAKCLTSRRRIVRDVYDTLSGKAATNSLGFEYEGITTSRAN